MSRYAAVEITDEHLNSLAIVIAAASITGITAATSDDPAVREASRALKRHVERVNELLQMGISGEGAFEVRPVHGQDEVREF